MRQSIFLKNSFSSSCLKTGFKKSITTGLILATSLLLSCSDHKYNSLQVGKLTGRLVIEWINKDVFRFIKDEADPLKFTRFDGMAIIPENMITDGSSVPRTLRSVKTYSPWGFAPAFVIHDWLFQMKSCKLPGHEKLTFEASADIMAEIIKTMMETKDFGDPDVLTLYSLHQAVKSRHAKKMWDEGVCLPVPSATKPVPTATKAVRSRLEAPKQTLEDYDKAAKLFQQQMEMTTRIMAMPSQFSFEQKCNY